MEKRVNYIKEIFSFYCAAGEVKQSGGRGEEYNQNNLNSSERSDYERFKCLFLSFENGNC